MKYPDFYIDLTTLQNTTAYTFFAPARFSTRRISKIVAPVVMTTYAMAGSSASTEIGKRHARPAAHSAPQHHHQHAHRTFTHGLSNDPYYSVRPQVPVFRGPGYVYVPGKGIVGEACNLPTSACPNEMREIQ